MLRPETRDKYLSYEPAGKGTEWKSFWFHVGNFESLLPERIAGAPKSKQTGRVLDLVAVKSNVFLAPLQNSKTKELLVIM